MSKRIAKRERTTVIYFNEQEQIIHIQTHNTSLKRRLLSYSKTYPEVCKLVSNSTGDLSFEMPKARFCFRLTAPYSITRRTIASENAKKNGLHSRKELKQ